MKTVVTGTVVKVNRVRADIKLDQPMKKPKGRNTFSVMTVPLHLLQPENFVGMMGYEDPKTD
jgi:hypothetical protein